MAAKKGWAAVHEKKLKKAIKKAHKAYLVVAALALVIGIAGGYFAASVICGNDVFELKGQKETTVKIGDEIKYTDEGIKYVSFGKDLSSSFAITTNLTHGSDGTYTGDTSEETEYYIIYTITEGRCEGMTLYRTFNVTK